MSPDSNHKFLGQSLQQAFQYLADGKIDQAVQLGQRLVRQYPDIADIHHLQAMIFEYEKKWRQAMQAVQRCIKLKEDNPLYFLTLARINQGLERSDAVEQALLHAVTLRPDMFDAYVQLGIFCSEQKRYHDAEQHYLNALKLRANDPVVSNNLGTVLHELGRFAEAIEYYKNAIALRPDYITALLNLANSYKTLGSFDQAINTYERILMLNPGVSEAHVQIGEIYRYQGDMESAAKSYCSAIKQTPGFTEAYRLLSQVRREHPQTDVVKMEALSAGQLSDAESMHLHFALGKVYEDRSEQDKAFVQIKNGNDIYRKQLKYNVGDDVKLFDKIAKLFDQDYFLQRQSISGSTASPIFIIGMPRTGTTLVETILASHRDVFGAGEINNLAEIISSDGNVFPSSFRNIKQAKLVAMAKNYLNILSSLNMNGTKLVSNKMPSNFIYLGVIYLLFPGAKIIHCVRNPIDTCLSCYKQYFSGAQTFAYNLTDLARYYAAYHKLMQHWHTVLPGFIFDLNYEELVHSPDELTKQLLNYCQLEWDEACRSFYLNKRKVQTASSSQVRRPIYQNSVQAWERYESHLKPLIDQLLKEGVGIEQQPS